MLYDFMLCTRLTATRRSLGLWSFQTSFSRRDLIIMSGEQSGPLNKRRPNNGIQHSRKKSRPRQPTRKEGTNDEILSEEVRRMLECAHISTLPHGGATDGANVASYQPPKRFSEVEVVISELSSTGDGLGLSASKNHVYVVPFTAPGDVVMAKLVRYKHQERYTLSDLVSVKQPAPQRDDSLIKCAYFARCGGCAFQMLPYAAQLAHKKMVVERAYARFSDLDPAHVPAVGDTVGSPLQYGYRTKLTPHFDKPPGPRRRKDGEPRPKFADVPPIGFNYKNMNRVLDVEDCPIGTDAVRRGIVRERANVAERLEKYTKGATILLRESTTRTPREPEPASESKEDQAARVAYDETKTCITDNNATSTEYVDDYVFQNPAGSFFQNNNSILPRFTQYIRDHVLPPSTAASPTPITVLLDAYCGSGLFTITLAPLFKRSIGIDISAASIEFARTNARLNKMGNTTFHAATAAAIFGQLPKDVDPNATAVVIDPPRKGCDEDFLRQLLEFGPRRVCYVSCNVHTQARDVGVLVEGAFAGNGDEKMGGQTARRYRIESIRGFDFFPQSSHVESVAVLERIDEEQA